VAHRVDAVLHHGDTPSTASASVMTVRAVC
jgi:hypothetical protein